MGALAGYHLPKAFGAAFLVAAKMVQVAFRTIAVRTSVVVWMCLAAQQLSVYDDVGVYTSLHLQHFPVAVVAFCHVCHLKWRGWMLTTSKPLMIHRHRRLWVRIHLKPYLSGRQNANNIYSYHAHPLRAFPHTSFKNVKVYKPIFRKSST